MLDLSTALNQLRECKISHDEKTLSRLLMELEVVALNVDRLPSDFFEGVLDLLKDDSFLELEGSWKVLYFINNNWDQISSEQRERLRKVLVSSFDRYNNWMGAFVTSEILGEHYSDDLA